MGNAPGPDLTLAELTLEVRPNPVFNEDGSAIEENKHTIGQGTHLKLKVENNFLLKTTCKYNFYFKT